MVRIRVRTILALVGFSVMVRLRSRALGRVEYSFIN